MRQSIKFLVVGMLNTIVGYGTFFIFYQVGGVHYPFALFISHVIGVTHSFLWNSKWTFSSGKVTLIVVVKFCIIYIVTFLINLALLSFLVESIDLEVMYAQMISLIITTLISFLGHKYWSFK